jgi:hypothetical protein
MLSSITPFSERGRGHRYSWTAGWFVVGAAVGGATLGGSAAVLAVVVSAVGLVHHPLVLGLSGGGLALAGAGVDLGVFGPVLPLIRRQVDDGWLSKYRPWFYGAGFGWQIGSGLATYLMSAGVVVVVVLAALTGSPYRAVLMGTGFGLARGLTVFLTWRCSEPARLRILHQRLDRAGPVVRAVVVAAQAVAGVVLIPLSGLEFVAPVWLAVVVPSLVLVATLGGSSALSGASGLGPAGDVLLERPVPDPVR